MTYSNSTIDARAPYGTHLVPPGPFEGVSSIRAVTRVTFDRNPMTGSTVTDATPAAGTPTT